jgi:hypothetical protein
MGGEQPKSDTDDTVHNAEEQHRPHGSGSAD